MKYYRKAFTELAMLTKTAICCRVTPSQKAQVPLLVSCLMLFFISCWDKGLVVVVLSLLPFLALDVTDE